MLDLVKKQEYEAIIESFVIKDKNNMDPSEIFRYLPIFSLAKAIWIDLAYVYIGFWIVKKCQYKYSSYFDTFM